jgi:hypothetical protein
MRKEVFLLLRLAMKTLSELLSQLIVDLVESLYAKVRGSSLLYLLRRISEYLVLIVVLQGVV